MRACGWACSRVGMQMWMAVNKKEKRKKTLTGCFERADGRAEADNCKKKKKERKGKKKEKFTGLGVWTCYRWACMRLRANVDGCKQTNKKKGKEKRNGMDLPQVVGMSVQFEQCSNTVFKCCQTRTNCSNTVRTHGNEYITCPNTVRTVFEHCQTRTNCSNSVRTAHHCTAGCLNMVRTVFEH